METFSRPEKIWKWQEFLSGDISDSHALYHPPHAAQSWRSDFRPLGQLREVNTRNYRFIWTQ